MGDTTVLPHKGVRPGDFDSLNRLMTNYTGSNLPERRSGFEKLPERHSAARRLNLSTKANHGQRNRVSRDGRAHAKIWLTQDQE